MKKRRIPIIILSVILILLVLILGYFIPSKQTITENTNEQVISIDSKDFDFDKLEKTLHSAVQDDSMIPLICLCDNYGGASFNEELLDYSINEVSTTTIDTIIQKLKIALSIEKNVNFSWVGCPPNRINYYISVKSSDYGKVHEESVFSLYYAIDSDTFLVKYNNTGYAFHYDGSDEVIDFIENLK